VSVGLGLLRKLIEEEVSAQYLDENGVSADLFIKEERLVYSFLRDHLINEGQMPQLETVEAQTEVDFPKAPDEPLSYWIRQAKIRAEKQELVDGAEKILEAVRSGEVDSARDMITGLYGGLDRHSARKQLWGVPEVVLPVVDKYLRRRNAYELSGAPFGFPFLDGITDGAQGGDTVAIVGRPATGKSYVMLHGAKFAHEQGERPLFVTMEMPKEQCVRRIICMKAGVPSEQFRLGRLSRWSEVKIDRAVSEIQGDNGEPFLIHEAGMNTSVEDVVMRVKELQPSVVYIDGAYLLRTRDRMARARWEKIAGIAETVKAAALEFNMPFICSYQFNRRGAGGVENIAGADVIGQLASIVLAIWNKNEPTVKAKRKAREEGVPVVWDDTEKMLELIKGREGESGTMDVKFDTKKTRLRQTGVHVPPGRVWTYPEYRKGVNDESCRIGDFEEDEDL
jgi:replicative DNA helicase